jgi:hypothetical protein
VVARARVPEGRPPAPLPEAVLALFATRFNSKSAARKACRRSLVLVDGVASGCSAAPAGGAALALLARVVGGPPPGQGGRNFNPPETGNCTDGPDNVPLRVCYEDDSLAVVYKPAGIDTGALRKLLPLAVLPSARPELQVVPFYPIVPGPPWTQPPF